jgi:hypothetical protein
MPEANTSPPKSKAGTDQRALAHVERWLAVIRELSGDRK